APDLLMLGLVRAGGIAPRVAAPLVEVDIQLAADLGMQPLGQALGGLDADTVDVELLGELAVTLEPLDQLGDLGADRHALEGDDVAFAGVDRAEEVGEADAVVLGLAREDEPLELAVGVLGIEDDELVAVGIAGEVPEPRPWMEVVLLAPHPLEPVREALLLVGSLDQLPPGLALDPFAAPVELEQHVAV